jgi:hypothetical protein
MDGQRHAAAALLLRERDPVPVREAGWAPVPIGTAAENLTSTGIRSRRPSSQSLYRLSYVWPSGGRHPLIIMTVASTRSLN